MTDESGHLHRRSIRLKDYDYSQAGAYFVTLVVQNRDCILGEIKNGSGILSEAGRNAAQTWEWLASQYPYVELSEWIVMPNHLHGILVIHPCRGGSRSAPTGTAPTQTNPTDTPVKIKPLGGLIGAFKTVSTKKWNELNNMTGVILWQRNYYEHIIRNGDEWERISR